MYTQVVRCCVQENYVLSQSWQHHCGSRLNDQTRRGSWRLELAFHGRCELQEILHDEKRDKGWLSEIITAADTATLVHFHKRCNPNGCLFNVGTICQHYQR